MRSFEEPEGYFTVDDYGLWRENKSGVGVPLYRHPENLIISDTEILDLYETSKKTIDYCQSNEHIFMETIKLVLHYINTERL